MASNPFSPEDDVTHENESEVIVRLDELDREVMERGVKELYRRLDKLEPDELPQVVLLLDTAARPLAHVLRPVIRKVYGRKGRPHPDIVYINEMKMSKFTDDTPFDFVPFDTSSVIELMDEAVGRGGDWRVPFRKFSTGVGDGEKRCAETIKLVESNLRNIEEAERTSSRKWGGDKPTRFLVVDDYAVGGTTLAYADGLIALRQIGQGLDVNDLPGTRTFFLFGASSNFDPGFLWSPAAKRSVWVGSHNQEFSGFGFRGNARSIGVEKALDPPRIIRSPSGSPAEMRALRREIEKISSASVGSAAESVE